MFAIVVVSSESSLIVSQACDGAEDVEQFLSVSLSSSLLRLKVKKKSTRLQRWVVLQAETKVI